MKCYSWDAVKLSNAYTIDELVTLQKQVMEDPASRNPAHDDHRKSIWLYTKAARRKLDAIGLAITYKLKEKRDERTPSHEQ